MLGLSASLPKFLLKLGCQSSSVGAFEKNCVFLKGLDGFARVGEFFFFLSPPLESIRPPAPLSLHMLLCQFLMRIYY